MLSIRSLLNLEEGRGTSSSSSSTAVSSSVEKKSEDLGSWLSDYNKSKGLLGSFPSFSSSSSSSSSTAASSTTPSASASSIDSTSSGSNSWFGWGRADENTELIHSDSSTVTPSSSFSLSSPSSWLSAVPGFSSASAISDSSVCCGLSWHQRLGLFFLSFSAGVIMLFMSFSFFSLILLGMSAKFTLSYALANVFFLMSSSFLTGPYQQLATMCHPSRALLSTLYIVTLIALLLAAWQVRVFYVVLPLLVLQIVCLIMYVLSYLPFGLPMMKRLFSVFLTSMKKIFVS